MANQKPQQLQGRTVKTWALHGTNQGGAALIFGYEVETDDGEVVVVGETPLFASVEQCRSLAANLIEIADRLSGTAGRA